MSDYSTHPDPENPQHTSQPPPKQVGRCGLASDGLTIAGYKFSWILILLVIVVIILIFKKDEVAAYFTSSRPTVARAPVYGVSATTPSVANFTVPKLTMPTGEFARMFGHSY